MHEGQMAMRVELPDEPYTLGRIATALGANILHIDVHELDGADVVDEIVIAGSESLSPADVRSALLDAGARAVVSVPIVHRQMDAWSGRSRRSWHWCATRVTSPSSP